MFRSHGTKCFFLRNETYFPESFSLVVRLTESTSLAIAKILLRGCSKPVIIALYHGVGSSMTLRSYPARGREAGAIRQLSTFPYPSVPLPGRKKKPLPSQAGAPSAQFLLNEIHPNWATCNSFVIFVRHSARREYVFSPAFFTPLTYWRISDGLMPALLAISFTLKNEK